MKRRFQEISENNCWKHYVKNIFIIFLIPVVCLSLFFPLIGLAHECLLEKKSLNWIAFTQPSTIGIPGKEHRLVSSVSSMVDAAQKSIRPSDSYPDQRDLCTQIAMNGRSLTENIEGKPGSDSNSTTPPIWLSAPQTENTSQIKSEGALPTNSHVFSATDISSTITVSFYGSGSGTEECSEEWGFQRITYNMEVEIEVTGINPSESEGILSYDLAHVLGTIHFYGTAEDNFYGDTKTLNFDKSQYIDLQNTEGTLTSSNQGSVIYIGFSIPDSSNLPSSTYIQYSSSLEIIRNTVKMPYPWNSGVGCLSNNYDIPATADEPPFASFTYTPNNPDLIEEITFDASPSYDQDGEIVSYEWDFGDGNSAVEKTVHHRYRRFGKYNVTLKVTDDSNLSGTFTVEITPGCSNRNLKPYAWEINFPDVKWYTAHGLLGDPIRADSGEWLEVWWVNDYEDGHYLHPYYELKYHDSDGIYDNPIGRCHFSEGVNEAYYYAPDEDDNGIPDYFTTIHWTSIDSYEDDPRKVIDPDTGEISYIPNGLLDIFCHHFNACTKKYSRYRDYWTYKCGPPISTKNNFTDYFCDPPWDKYVNTKTEYIDPFLGPASDALFDELWLEYQSSPPLFEPQMGHFSRSPCDIDWDGDCDARDRKAIEEIIGKCWEHTDFNAIFDIDADGCITEADLNILFGRNTKAMPWIPLLLLDN